MCEQNKITKPAACNQAGIRTVLCLAIQLNVFVCLYCGTKTVIGKNQADSFFLLLLF